VSDIIVILLAALVAFLLWKYVVGSGAAPATRSSRAPYGSALIKSAQEASEAAIHAIDEVVANSAKQLGGLAAVSESNILRGAAKAYEKAPVAKPTSKSLKRAVASQLTPGIEVGEGSVTGPVATGAAAAGAAIPTALDAFVQGFMAARTAGEKLPAVKALNKNAVVDRTIWSGVKTVEHFVEKHA
jgi:hypothetical protein